MRCWACLGAGKRFGIGHMQIDCPNCIGTGTIEQPADEIAYLTEIKDFPPIAPLSAKQFEQLAIMPDEDIQKSDEAVDKMSNPEIREALGLKPKAVVDLSYEQAKKTLRKKLTTKDYKPSDARLDELLKGK